MSIENADKVRRAMQASFGHEKGKEALLHLAGFCCALKSTFSSDPIEMARMCGRREVWLEILVNVNMTEQDLLDYAKQMGNDYE